MSAFIARSAEETRALGQRLSSALKAGDVVLLSGDMGAGKSELARGIARGLGVTGAVPSPTFTILNTYKGGRLPLYHFDWYRIQDPDELYAIGAEEYIGTDGVTLIEWHALAPELLPTDALEIALTPTDEQTRVITLTARGAFILPDIK